MCQNRHLNLPRCLDDLTTYHKVKPITVKEDEERLIWFAEIFTLQLNKTDIGRQEGQRKVFWITYPIHVILIFTNHIHVIHTQNLI